MHEHEINVTHFPEDDNPERLIGDEADDNFEYDLEAEDPEGVGDDGPESTESLRGYGAYLAVSLQRLESEVNKRWPNRDNWSDGWLGDDSHATRFSDHNPENGVVHAYDFDATLKHAMGSGPVGDALCGVLLQGCRSGYLRNVVNYIIYKSRIYSKAYGYRARYYNGSNPHDSHVHISIHRTSFARNWKGSWRVNLSTIDASKVARAFDGHPASAPRNVRRVQKRLVAKGILTAPYIAGRAGGKTKKAMKKWQGRNGYKADGVPGYYQLRKLAGKHYRVVQ